MTRRTLALITTLTALPFAALGISACGSGGGDNPTPPKTASGKTATIGVESAGGLGKILVDSTGRTVYLFKKDTSTKSQCTGECATAWPPVRVNSKPVAGPTITASKLATTKRSDGKPQVTYNGHPLYLYSLDNQPGDTNGQGINAFGASWFALTAAGNQASGTGTNSNPGAGY